MSQKYFFGRLELSYPINQHWLNHWRIITL